ncbi:hypothetical protein QBZ16_003174 [Prototheca wickerhamii]|uniref:Uncharacterized protein n=1 Tax=Prototheca wickerhamii TaxID=3111 RepID=A0AAD9IH06_PROWI|nr:hypothetical protein QBZ16_003174 [Prototheca wickerhamii]
MGSTVIFRLTSSAGERVSITVKLDSTSTFAHQRYYLPHSIKRQANFTGTAEYEGRPDESWQVLDIEPGVKATYWGKELAFIDGQYWLYYVVNMPVDNRQVAISSR